MRDAGYDAWVQCARAVPIEREIDRRRVKLRGENERVGPCPRCGGDNRFSINIKKRVWNCRGCGIGGDVIKLVEHLDDCDFKTACTTLVGEPPPKAKANGKDHDAAETRRVVVAEFPYLNEFGAVAFVSERIEYRKADGSFVLRKDGKHKKTFRQKRPDPEKPGHWIWDTDGVPIIPYRLPELIEAIANERRIIIVEGEAKVDLLWSWNVPATCCVGGAGKWKAEHSAFLRGADVVILPDNDEPGRKHVDVIGSSLQDIATRIRVLVLPALGEKKDIEDWATRGGTVEKLHGLIECEARPWTSTEAVTSPGVSLDEFFAYMVMHNYIFVPTRDLWPASSVNGRIPPVSDGSQTITASAWLDKHKPVEQMTWAPGEPLLIKDRLLAEGGWVEHPGVACFNLYRPPNIVLGDPNKAGPWLDHVHRVFGDSAEHILQWLAHRRQRPAEKINHALVLGGAQGIGKDTALEPVKRAVGPWNFAEVSPQHMLGRFNGYLRSVILRISEARDLGEYDRFKFYDHLKSYIAAPPDVLRVDEKNLREYYIPNVCGVIITTNYKTDGIFLPADDRRHFVPWSDLAKEAFDEKYWARLWSWYDSGGNRDVAAYLAQLDISGFNPKAPPPKTAAFWEIVDASRAPEDAEMQDAIDALGTPDVLTLEQVASRAPSSFAEYLCDRKNARRIPHRLEACGYVVVRNDAAKDGRWKINGRRQTIYGNTELPLRDRIAAAQRLVHSE